MKNESLTIDKQNQVCKRDEGLEVYYVLVNDEEQYSIWPSFKPIPGGWKVKKEPLPKSECLEYIDHVWTDMRPLSLRNKIDELGRVINLSGSNSSKLASRQ